MRCRARLSKRWVRTGLRGFHAWAFDYVTFENTGVTRDPFTGQIIQVSLRSVNTDLATLTGCESFFELAPNERLTPFFNCRYVDGRDRTRNGNFATVEARETEPHRRKTELSHAVSSATLSAQRLNRCLGSSRLKADWD